MKKRAKMVSKSCFNDDEIGIIEIQKLLNLNYAQAYKRTIRDDFPSKLRIVDRKSAYNRLLVLDWIEKYNNKTLKEKIVSYNNNKLTFNNMAVTFLINQPIKSKQIIDKNAIVHKYKKSKSKTIHLKSDIY